MNCNEAGLLIYLFMDKETDEGEEKELFSHLAECSKCREEFRLLRHAQKAFINSLEEYPERLDKRVIESLKKKEMKRRDSIFTMRLPAYYLYAASISAIILLALYLFRINDYNQQRKLDMNKLNVMLAREYEQGEYINLIMNQLPGIKIRAEVDDPGIVRRGM
ncbi:MAG: anti-sigma factor [Ignavibacteriaceae bacterium]|nr:anti-sigma factor [Ignavibacteriaceae bacterium]